MPTQIGTGSNWLKIGGGYKSSIAIKNDGTLWTWGNNASGQLGDGTTINTTTPAQIGTATNWTEIDGGEGYNLALKSDGTLWAWGSNTYGQLGDGTTINKTTPIQIGTATNWAKISSRYRTSYAIKTDGTLWAWGFNSNGQMGDGTTVNKLTPTQIGTLNNYNSVSAGYIHAIAVKTDNTAVTFGSNNYGQIGNNFSGAEVSSPFTLGCVTVGIEEFTQTQAFEIYPNPTSGIVKIKLELLNEANTKLIITNLFGEVVLSEIITENNTQLNVNDFKKGIYFVTLENKGGKSTRKIIIE